MKNREWKQGPESNRRRADYGSAVLPLNYPAVDLSRARPLLLTHTGLITRANLAEANCCASHAIGLLLRNPVWPLVDGLWSDSQRIGQGACSAEKRNCVLFSHGEGMVSVLELRCQAACYMPAYKSK